MDGSKCRFIRWRNRSSLWRASDQDWSLQIRTQEFWGEREVLITSMYLCNHLHIVWQSRRKEFRPVIYTVEKAIQLDSAVHTLLLLCVCVLLACVCVCVSRAMVYARVCVWWFAICWNQYVFKMHNILYKVTLVEGAKYIFLLFLVSLLLPDPYKMQRGNFKVLSFPQNPEGSCTVLEDVGESLWRNGACHSSERCSLLETCACSDALLPKVTNMLQ